MASKLTLGLVIAGLTFLLPAPSSAQFPAESAEPPGALQILVQSELDYLDAADRRITIELEEAPLGRILREIGKQAGFTIDVERLPAGRKLTLRFEDRPVRDVLAWLAGEVPIDYKVEEPDRLLVLGRKPPDTPSGS